MDDADSEGDCDDAELSEASAVTVTVEVSGVGDCALLAPQPASAKRAKIPVATYVDFFTRLAIFPEKYEKMAGVSSKI